MTTVGIDLGGTKCLAVALDHDHRVVAEHRVPTPTEGGAAALLDALESVARRAVGPALAGVTAVGVGAPGLVDRDGVLRSAAHLEGVTGLRLRDEMSRRFGLPVTVENDATCATWGEHDRGAAAGFDEVVMVTIGTGIGGGLISGGRLVRGADGFAGEVGHMVVSRDGPACTCGRRGCWEMFASGSALGRMGAEAAAAGRAEAVRARAGGDAAGVRGEHVTEAASAGDAQAEAVMREFAGWIALGLANLSRILDPELIVIGGGISDIGDVLFTPLRVALAPLADLGDGRPPLRVEPAALGERAGAIGAAGLAAARFSSPQRTGVTFPRHSEEK